MPPTCLVCLVSGRSGAFCPRIRVFLWTAPPSNPVPSTLGQFLWTTPPSNPVPSTFGVFLWTTLPSNPVPSTFGVVFVDRKDEETMFVRTSDSSSECAAP